MACNSTTFKRVKRSLSPFDAELSCVHWAMTKEDYYCQGARRILICSNAKSLKGFLSQDLEKIENKRKQRMVEEMTPYNVNIRYVPGPKLEFADHGSRYPISYGQHKWFESEPGELGICVPSCRNPSAALQSALDAFAALEFS